MMGTKFLSSTFATNVCQTQQLWFIPLNEKTLEISSATPEEIPKEVKQEMRDDSRPAFPYQYKEPEEADPDYRRWQGHWERDKRGKRYWKTDFEHKPASRHGLLPREGGRWPLLDAKGANRHGGLFTLKDRWPQLSYPAALPPR